MNLLELIQQLPATSLANAPIPAALFGAFRRKSITFSNGLTDEQTIVYWFQSKSFTLDLRLKDRLNTPIAERQAWIGQTLWDAEQQLLSWEVDPAANYQNHIQWPEPARLHMIGNCILEFSPSQVYVEDWRQQAVPGLFLGLRLNQAIHQSTQKVIALHGGLIICGQHIAYAQSRLPDIQAQILAYLNLEAASEAGISANAINSYELSIGTDGQHIRYSTQNQRLDQAFNLENFTQVDEKTLQQTVQIGGEAYQLYFELDVYQPDYTFPQCTPTSPQSQQWLQTEQQHLLHHAQVVI